MKSKIIEISPNTSTYTCIQYYSNYVKLNFLDRNIRKQQDETFHGVYIIIIKILIKNTCCFFFHFVHSRIVGI